MFKDLLKKLRFEKGITQPQLAAALNVSKGNVGDWETGKSKPGYSAIIALAHYFGVTADFLLELDSEGRRHKKAGEANLECDDIPLNQTEMDLISMYRFINALDRKTVYDIAKMKYDQTTGEKESSYSTYTDTHEPQGGEPQNMNNSGSGIA